MQPYSGATTLINPEIWQKPSQSFNQFVEKSPSFKAEMNRPVSYPLPSHRLKNLDSPPSLRMTRRVRQINLFDSGRVSVNWFAVTRRQKDTLNWGIVAPPALGRKRMAVDKWLIGLVAQEKITFE